MKKIFAFLKKYWLGTLTIIAAAVGIAINFFQPDGPYSGAVISLVLTLIAVEFFTLSVGRLDSISGALKRMEDREPRGVQLRKWDASQMSQLIGEAKKTLFFCGCALAFLVTYRGELLAASERVNIQLLVMDIDDKKVVEQFEVLFGRLPNMNSLDHIARFASIEHFEIRVLKFPPPFYACAKDLDTVAGTMQIGYQEYGGTGYNDFPCMDLTSVNSEFYGYYKNQIELLWEKGTPWQP